MTPVIELDRISKSYRIRHQDGGAARYQSLRDDLAGLFTLPARFLRRKPDSIEEFWALRDVSFEVHQGDVVGLVGRNGSGKSTLLKILSRITTPTAGQAVLHGRVASLLEVGTGFHAELTGRENIFFNGSVLGMRKREIARKFDEIVAFAGTEQFLDTPVKFYSSGMYVRLAFAVAAHLEPDILLVDEVLAVGDAEFQRKCLGRMEDVSREGRTILFVSHNMGSIRQLCTRGVLLRAGEATLYDSTSELAAAYSRQMRSDDGAGEVVLSRAGLRFDRFRLNGLPPGDNLQVPQGEPIRVSFRYQTERARHPLLIGLGIKNTATQEFPVYTNNHLENVRHMAEGSGLVEAELLVPSLAPGRYLLEFHLNVDDEYVFEYEPVTEFAIVEEPAFASGQVLSTFPSIVLIDSKWRFEKT